MAEKDILDNLNLGDSSSIQLNSEDLLKFMDPNGTGAISLEGVREIDEQDNENESQNGEDADKGKDFLSQETEHSIAAELGRKQLFESDDEDQDEDKPKDKTPNKEIPKSNPSADTGDLSVAETFTNLFKSLEKNGIFSESGEDWKIEKDEDIVDRLRKEGQMIASDYLESLFAKGGEENRDFIEKVVLNGVNAAEYFKLHKASLDLENLDMDDTETLKEVFIQHQVGVLGFSKEKAQKNLKRVIDSGDLEEEGKEALEILKENSEKQKSKYVQDHENKIKNQQILKKQAIEASERMMSEAIKTKNLGGLKINQTEATSVLDYVNQDKYVLPDGSYLSEFEKDLLELRRPENLENRFMLAMLLKNKFNIEKIEKNIKSDKAESYFDSLVKKGKQPSDNTNKNKNFF